MKHIAVRRSKAAALAILVLSGGTVLSTCQTRFRDAVISGSKSYLYSGLLPSLLDQMGLSDTEEDESETEE